MKFLLLSCLSLKLPVEGSDCHSLNENRDLMQKGHNVTPTFCHTAVTAPLYWQWPVYNTVYN